MDNDHSHQEPSQRNPSSRKPAQQVHQFPLKLLVLSQLATRGTGAALLKPERFQLDKSSFKEILEKFKLHLVLKVPNKLSDMPKELTLELGFTEMGSFRPEAIVDQVPELKELLDLRTRLGGLRDQTVSRQDLAEQLKQLSGRSMLVEQIRKALLKPSDETLTQTPPVPSGERKVEDTPKKTQKDELANILDMVETPESSPDTTSSAAALVNQFASDIARSGKPEKSLDGRSLDTLTATLDATLSSQLNEILHHPQFQYLESSWRGLKCLVDRTDFRQDIKIEVLNTAKSDLLETFTRQIFNPESEGLSDAPISVIIADYQFDSSLEDRELLQSLSQKAEMLQTPFITSIGPAFFDLESTQHLDQLPALSEVFNRPDYIKWTGFRKTESSRWLALTFNRFLLRMSYNPEENPVKTFNFTEKTLDEETDYLWGNPVWALGCLLGTSFARLGWPTEITGTRTGGGFADLPAREFPREGGDKSYIPLETLIPEERQWELSGAGIIALTSRKNTDSVQVVSAPTFHIPERYSDARETQKSGQRAQLAYQLFASRIVHYIGLIQGEIIPGNTAEGIRRDFTGALRNFVSVSGELPPDAVQATIVESEEKPGEHQLVLQVGSGPEILGGQATVELGMRLRR